MLSPAGVQCQPEADVLPWQLRREAYGLPPYILPAIECILPPVYAYGTLCQQVWCTFMPTSARAVQCPSFISSVCLQVWAVRPGRWVQGFEDDSPGWKGQCLNQLVSPLRGGPRPGEASNIKVRGEYFFKLGESQNGHKIRPGYSWKHVSLKTAT